MSKKDDYTSPEFWAKAPEVATHYVRDLTPPKGDPYSGWARFDGSVYRAIKDEGYWPMDGDAFECIPRTAEPATWSGEGLPPVGTVCEYKSGRQDSDIPFNTCTIIAHFDGETQRCAAYTHIGHDGVVLVGQGTAAAFRPIRTPEQLAAEAREKAISVIIADAGVTGSAFALDPEAAVWAAALYDAGYRKVEA